MKVNYHTHTKLCGHAIGMSEEYVIEAIKHHFTELGFSDHGPIPINFMSKSDYQSNLLDRQMDIDIFNKVYLPDIEKSIIKYGSKIKVLKGLEIEYLSGHDEYYRELLNKLDYLSLGVHYFETPNGIYNTYDIMTKKTIYQYGETVVKALNTGLFKILNHPDIYLMNYINDKGKGTFDDDCERVAMTIIEAAINNNVVLEINGGGPRRDKKLIDGRLKYSYPRDEFWRVVERYKDAKIIIGCDTHNPAELYDNVIKGIEKFAKKYSFRVIDHIEF